MNEMYDWEKLSSSDFEQVSRDIMANILGNHVETFRPGIDGGVDLRDSTDSRVIGQAKHFSRSGLSKLKKELEKEATKLRKRTEQPNRYFVFTSVELNPQQKQEILKSLDPFVLLAGDIFGRDDMNSLVRDNPAIEERNFKLWLTSARVLGRITRSAAKNRSSLRVKHILAKSRFLVMPEEMHVASEILSKHHNLVISGSPGIGKTTLAELLALDYLAEDYEITFCATIRELEDSYKEGVPQLFILDDFLGRTRISEAPQPPEQEHLFRFMKAISHADSNSYLILTTREYLWKQAQAINDRISKSQARVAKYLLHVKSYSRQDRAQILYNHLFWRSDIPVDQIVELIANKEHLKIIDHSNFNPRFIDDTLNMLEWPHMKQADAP